MFQKKILLQGLDPKLSGYEAALALYEWEAGKNQKRYAILFFLEQMLLENFGKRT